MSDGGLDSVNRPTWVRAVGEMVDADGWSDPGEREAVALLAPRLRNRRILDVGVGAGRTAWLLPLLTASYSAVDYTPEMVAAARERHPDLDIRHGDARDLGEYADESVDALVFSFNGLDALDVGDRGRALDEFHRVLAPGGVLLFSTLNRDGAEFRTPPWRRWALGRSGIRGWATFVLGSPFRIPRWRREVRNWRRLRSRVEVHPDRGVAPLSAHEYGLLVHFSTVGGERRELARHGFELESVIGSDGAVVDPAAESCAADWFHVIATRLPHPAS